jgi:hypothetical protein
MLTVMGLSEAVRFNKQIANKKNYQQMMDDILNDTVALMRRRAPHETGRLLDSIYWIRTGDGQYRIFVNVLYAYFMEYGFSGFNIGTIEHPKYMKSGMHPFMRSSIWEMNKLFPWYLNKNVFRK